MNLQPSTPPATHTTTTSPVAGLPLTASSQTAAQFAIERPARQALAHEDDAATTPIAQRHPRTPRPRGDAKHGPDGPSRQEPAGSTPDTPMARFSSASGIGAREESLVSFIDRRRPADRPAAEVAGELASAWIEANGGAAIAPLQLRKAMEELMAVPFRSGSGWSPSMIGSILIALCRGMGGLHISRAARSALLEALVRSSPCVERDTDFAAFVRIVSPPLASSLHRGAQAEAVAAQLLPHAAELPTRRVTDLFLGLARQARPTYASADASGSAPPGDRLLAQLGPQLAVQTATTRHALLAAATNGWVRGLSHPNFSPRALEHLTRGQLAGCASLDGPGIAIVGASVIASLGGPARAQFFADRLDPWLVEAADRLTAPQLGALVRGVADALGGPQMSEQSNTRLVRAITAVPPPCSAGHITAMVLALAQGLNPRGLEEERWPDFLGRQQGLCLTPPHDDAFELRMQRWPLVRRALRQCVDPLEAMHNTELPLAARIEDVTLAWQLPDVLTARTIGTMAGGVCTLDVAPAHQSSLLLALVRHAGRLAGLGLFEMTRRLIADELRTCRMPPLRSDDLDEWIEGLWAASLGTAAGRDTKAPAGKPVKVLEPEAGEWREAGVRLRQLYELLLAHPMNETPLARQLAFAQQELDAVNAMEALPADLKPPLVQALTRHRDTLRQRLKPDDADPDDLG